MKIADRLRLGPRCPECDAPDPLKIVTDNGYRNCDQCGRDECPFLARLAPDEVAVRRDTVEWMIETADAALDNGGLPDDEYDIWCNHVAHLCERLGRG